MKPDEIPYRPLNISKRQIRLLEIRPGAWDDVIQCRLHAVSLTKKPAYEALSYVWGDANERARIIVDEVDTTVTVSLQRALRRLRLVRRLRIIWADALCINQGDVAERGHQVGMMAALYSSCSRCVIWLGEAEDNPLEPYDLDANDEYLQKYRESAIFAFEGYLTSQQGTAKMRPIKRNIELDSKAELCLDVEAGFDLAKMLAEDANRHLYELPFYEITEFSHFRICRNWQNAWHSLLNVIGDRPWWRRTWTVQEAILPKLAIVQLGDHEISLQTLFSAASIFYTHDDGCCGDAYGKLWDPGFLGRPLLAAYLRIREIRSILDARKAGSIDHIGLYSLSTQRQATDPRDSIFGMLRIFPYLLDAGDSPEYSKSTAVVYSEATRRMCEDDDSLDSLEYASLPKAREHLQLPSWVLDWGTPESRFPSGFYTASGPFEETKTLQLQSSPTPFILPIRSLRIGTVSIIGAKTKVHGSVFDTLLNWGRLSTDLNITFWRTVFQNERIARLGTENSMLEDELDVVQRWWKWISTPDSEQSRITWSGLYGKGPTDDVKRVSFQLRMRCLLDDGVGVLYFITKLGGPGLTRACIEVGDQIYVAKGCNSPIILRPVGGKFQDVTDEIRSDTYQFVSTCYLDGFMDGEGVQGDIDWKTLYLR